MARREKLIQRIKARPLEAKYSDVQALLRLFGWTKDRQKGSHATYVHPENPLSLIVVIDGGTKVKRPYLNRICEYLELDD